MLMQTVFISFIVYTINMNMLLGQMAASAGTGGDPDHVGHADNAGPGTHAGQCSPRSEAGWNKELDVMALLDVYDDLDEHDDQADLGSVPRFSEAMDTDETDGRSMGAGSDRPPALSSPSAEAIPLAKGVKPLLGEAELGELPAISTVPKNPGPSSSAYTTIRNSRLKMYNAPDIYGKHYVPAINEAFYNEGDPSASRVRIVSSLALNRTISTTFDPTRFICQTCPKAHSIGLKPGQQAPVFVLADQCFPALAAPDGEGGCLAIICMEDGSLKELADLFLEITKTRSLVRSTVGGNLGWRPPGAGQHSRLCLGPSSGHQQHQQGPASSLLCCTWPCNVFKWRR